MTFIESGDSLIVVVVIIIHSRRLQRGRGVRVQLYRIKLQSPELLQFWSSVVEGMSMIILTGRKIYGSIIYMTIIVKHHCQSTHSGALRCRETVFKGNEIDNTPLRPHKLVSLHTEQEEVRAGPQTKRKEE